MNNDIPGELTKYIRSNAGYPAPKSMPSQQGNETPEVILSDFGTTQDYLNALGRTKVNIDRVSVNGRVADSVQSLKDDECFAQNHVDFCDGLLKQGYSLEAAIDTTDSIFNTLHDEKTYRQ